MTRRFPSASWAAPALLASALLAVGIAGCGGASAKQSVHRAADAAGHLKADGDKDADDQGAGYPHPEQDDQEFLARYGHGADPATASAIAVLVKRYYAATLAGDATRACALLDPTLARQLTEQSAAGACPAALAPALAQRHRYLLTEEPATMTVLGVYARGTLGLAVLGFRRSPETDVLVEREGSAWKLDSLFDNRMT